MGASLAPVAVRLEETGPCDGDGTLDVAEAGHLVVTLRNVGAADSPADAGTVRVASDSPLVRFPAGRVFSTPAVAAFALVELRVPVLLDDVVGPVVTTLSTTVTGAMLAPPSLTTSSIHRLNFDRRVAATANDDFEGTPGVWLAGADGTLPGASPVQLVELTLAQHVWFIPGTGGVGDAWLESPLLQVGSEPLTLAFQHRFELDRAPNHAFDGVVLELSADDGGTWLDVGELSAPGYTGTLDTAPSANPLAGRRAWVGISTQFPAFHQESLRLGTAWANQEVRLRFRFGSDDATALGGKGWELDDVRLTGLRNAPFPAIVIDPNACTNSAPRVTVGPDFEMDEGARVELVGDATDADGDLLEVTWVQRSGPEGVLLGRAFTAPSVTKDEEVVFELQANDRRAYATPGLQRALVRQVNAVPTVRISGSGSASAGQRVVLTATATDSDGEVPTLHWSQPEGPAVTLDTTQSPRATFVAPEGPATLTFAVIASDGRADSLPATHTVLVAGPAVEPTPPPVPMAPSGCGCGAVEAPAVLLLLGSARRRRRPA